ncbi:MBL fold metallo-hydrolase [Paenirhodobacter sp.]|uniref:MBL fold metallo-hydrolase n=1 Tax=Paenirhodobacter sp. TaxID=1965326 RepID=UPI003B3D3632
MMQELEPGVRRIVAPNPSPMTAQGTCSYVLGTDRVAVIDPGPADARHIRAILDGLDPGERVEAILVTHAHLDHSPGARLLSEATGVPIHAFGPPEAGRSEVMRGLAATGMAGGGEGVDAAFRPDAILADGAETGGATWQVRALHTPGHFGNHLSFAWGRRVFTGDVVMGWSSTLISPPDGDLGDYFRALERLRSEGAAVFYPGHGAPVTAPEDRLNELASHRHDRTAQIRAALAQGAHTVVDLTDRIYTDVPPALRGAARRNVFAHLVELVATGQAAVEGALSPDARFHPA